MAGVMSSRSEKIIGALGDAIKGAHEATRLLSEGRGLLDVERIIWDAYGRAEYAIFALKIEVGEGQASPAGKTNTGTENLGEVVSQAAKELQSGSDSYNAGRFSEALSLARTGRTRLRNLLVEARKLRKKPLLGATPQTPAPE